MFILGVLLICIVFTCTPKQSFSAYLTIVFFFCVLVDSFYEYLRYMCGKMCLTTYFILILRTIHISFLFCLQSSHWPLTHHIVLTVFLFCLLIFRFFYVALLESPIFLLGLYIISIFCSFVTRKTE